MPKVGRRRTCATPSPLSVSLTRPLLSVSLTYGLRSLTTRRVADETAPGGPSGEPVVRAVQRRSVATGERDRLLLGVRPRLPPKLPRAAHPVAGRQHPRGRLVLQHLRPDSVRGRHSNRVRPKPRTTDPCLSRPLARPLVSCELCGQRHSTAFNPQIACHRCSRRRHALCCDPPVRLMAHGGVDPLPLPSHTCALCTGLLEQVRREKERNQSERARHQAGGPTPSGEGATPSGGPNTKRGGGDTERDQGGGPDNKLGSALLQA